MENIKWLSTFMPNVERIMDQQLRRFGFGTGTYYDNSNSKMWVFTAPTTHVNKVRIRFVPKRSKSGADTIRIEVMHVLRPAMLDDTFKPVIVIYPDTIISAQNYEYCKNIHECFTKIVSEDFVKQFVQSLSEEFTRFKNEMAKETKCDMEKMIKPDWASSVFVDTYQRIYELVCQWSSRNNCDFKQDLFPGESNKYIQFNFDNKTHIRLTNNILKGCVYKGTVQLRFFSDKESATINFCEPIYEIPFEATGSFTIKVENGCQRHDIYSVIKPIDQFTEIFGKDFVDAVYRIFVECSPKNLNAYPLNVQTPMLIKGRVDIVSDLDNIQYPQTGWVYLVGLENADEFEEYVYTLDSTWKCVGTTAITVDSDEKIQFNDDAPKKWVALYNDMYELLKYYCLKHDCSLQQKVYSTTSVTNVHPYPSGINLLIIRKHPYKKNQNSSFKFSLDYDEKTGFVCLRFFTDTDVFVRINNEITNVPPVMRCEPILKAFIGDKQIPDRKLFDMSNGDPESKVSTDWKPRDVLCGYFGMEMTNTIYEIFSKYIPKQIVPFEPNCDKPNESETPFNMICEHIETILGKYAELKQFSFKVKELNKEHKLIDIFATTQTKIGYLSIRTRSDDKIQVNYNCYINDSNRVKAYIIFVYDQKDKILSYSIKTCSLLDIIFTKGFAEKIMEFASSRHITCEYKQCLDDLTFKDAVEEYNMIFKGKNDDNEIIVEVPNGIDITQESLCVVRNVISEVLNPIIQEVEITGGSWNRTTTPTVFEWCLTDVMEHQSRYIGARPYDDHHTIKIYTSIVSNVVITLTTNEIRFNKKADFKEFSEATMQEIFTRLCHVFYARNRNGKIPGWTLGDTQLLNAMLMNTIYGMASNKGKNTQEELKMEIAKDRTQEIKSAYFNPENGVCTILWMDGTKTISKPMNGVPSDPEVGFAICIAKKKFGGTQNQWRKWLKNVIATSEAATKKKSVKASVKLEKQARERLVSEGISEPDELQIKATIEQIKAENMPKDEPKKTRGRRKQTKDTNTD